MPTKQTLSQISEILESYWDPIGTFGIKEAAGEYKEYCTSILGMLIEGKSSEDIAAYLSNIELTEMGLTPNTTKIAAAAELLVKISHK